MNPTTGQTTPEQAKELLFQATKPHNKVTCPKCGYTWVSRLMEGQSPKQCPNCKQYMIKVSKP